MKNTRQKPSPPKWMNRLIKWCCKPDYVEYLLGDLEELFDRNFQEKGLTRAKRLYFIDTLTVLRPPHLKHLNFQILSSILPDMLYNYLKISFRNLFKRKVITLINVLGLAIGIAGGLLSYLHIQYELSYDHYHENSDRIYRIITGDMASGQGWVGVSAPIPPKLQADIPEIVDYVRMTKISRNSKVDISFNNQHYNETHFFLADPSLFTIFDIPLIAGNRETVLNNLRNIAISQRKAKQIFGNLNPIGKILKLNNQFEFFVAGVFEDMPNATHFKVDFAIPFGNIETILPGTSLTGNWGQFNYYAYALLQPNVSQQEVEAKIQSIKIKQRNNNEFSLERLGLQPLTDIHFQHNRGNARGCYPEASPG